MGEGGTRDYACTPHESCILHTDETAFEPLHLPFPFFNFFSFQRLNNWREEGNSSSRKVIENLIVAFRRSILFFFFFFLSLSPPSAVSTVPFRTNEIESVWSDAHEMLRIQLHRRILHLFFFFSWPKQLSWPNSFIWHFAVWLFVARSRDRYAVHYARITRFGKKGRFRFSRSFSFCYYINYFVDGISTKHADVIIMRDRQSA